MDCLRQWCVTVMGIFQRTRAADLNLPYRICAPDAAHRALSRDVARLACLNGADCNRVANNHSDFFC